MEIFLGFLLVLFLIGIFLAFVIGIYYLAYLFQKKEDAKNIAKGKIEAERLRMIKENQEKGLIRLLLRPGFPIGKSMEITGSEPFKQAVYKVLEELRSKAPHRYAEAVTRLPKAEFKSDLRSSTDATQKISGRSDGYFSIDGSDYERFRWVFLHEVGHNVAYKESNDHSEEAANNYANMVLRELGL